MFNGLAKQGCVVVIFTVQVSGTFYFLSMKYTIAEIILIPVKDWSNRLTDSKMQVRK